MVKSSEVVILGCGVAAPAFTYFYIYCIFFFIGLVLPLFLALSFTADGAVRAAISSESRMQGTVRRVTTAAALANAEGALGGWAMGLAGFLAEVGHFASVYALT